MFYESEVEDTNNLLLFCVLAQSICSKVYAWMGISVVRHSNLVEHFSQHRGLFAGKKEKIRIDNLVCCGLDPLV